MNLSRVKKMPTVLDLLCYAFQRIYMLIILGLPKGTTAHISEKGQFAIVLYLHVSMGCCGIWDGSHPDHNKGPDTHTPCAGPKPHPIDHKS